MNHSVNCLKVLLWKHVVVRARRYINTSIELLAPLLIIIILFSIRGLLQDKLIQSEHYQQGMATETIPFELSKDLTRVVYTPDTTLTSILMKEVGSQLKLPKHNFQPDHGISGYWATNESTVLNEFSKHIKYNEAILVFHDMGTDTWPKKLNYTIRIKEPFVTGLEQPMDGTYGPHETYGTIYNIFMSLQWAVDSSYIQLLSNQPIVQSITFQEFPYVLNWNNKGIEMVVNLLQLASYLSLVLPFVFLFSRLLDERCTGIQELIKMVGVTPNMLGITHFLNIVPTLLTFAIVSTILVKVSSNPILPHTSGLLIVVALILHASSIMSMAFATNYISKSLNYSTTIATFTFMLLWLPTSLTRDRQMSTFLRYATGMFPHTPIYWFWSEVGAKEIYNDGLQISDIFHAHANNTAPVAYGFLMMLVQTTISFLLTWYLDKVRPGPYGVALPWNFFFQKHYWTGQKVTPDMADEEMVSTSQDEGRYFEDSPTDLDVGIRVANVSKVFGSWHGPKTKALTNLSLNIYKGEITVLVGHNGAGKTTLMSIITGMIGSSEGQVFVNGKNAAEERDLVRRDLGLCPQHNLSFSDLTVEEHIVFFAMLKDKTYAEAKMSSKELISKLKLEGKEHSKSCELSGGMKRRLQLACALAGGASVLVLDEPTSGLDVETRRELWDLLLSLRGSRTVLLSTHFMEEVDALGDRVAAIHEGRLRCAATPMFLKRAIGTGYRLSLTLKRNAQPATITDTIQRSVPNATLTDQTTTTLTYKLPANSTEEFPDLFNELEQDRNKFGIETIGVGVTTLEEVFLKLCSDVDCSDSDITSNGYGDAATTLNKVSGLSLYLRIIWVLLMRQVKATLSVKWQFLTLQIIMPITAICLFTYVLNNLPTELSNMNSPSTLNMDLYKNLGNKMAYYDLDSDQKSLNVIQKEYPQIGFVKSTDMVNDILNVAIKDKIEYNKYLLGVGINATNANVYYSTILRHTAPVALNLLSNIFAAKTFPWADAKTITVINHPIKSSYEMIISVQAKSSVTCYFWAVITIFFVLGTLFNEVTLPCKERSQGSRHFHIMSGCPAFLYWLVTFLYDMVVYGVVIVTSVIVACKIFDYDNTFTRADFLGTMFGFLLLGGAAFLMFVYFVSFFFAERAAGLVLSVVGFAFGMIAPLLTVGTSELDTNFVFIQILSVVGQLFPAYPFTVGAMKITDTARLNAHCHLNKFNCPHLEIINKKFDDKICCATTLEYGPFEYLEYSQGGAEVVTLFIHIIFYGVLVLLLEHGVWGNLVDRVLNFNYRPLAHKYHDQEAKTEAKYVEEKFLNASSTNHAALVNNLHKRYFGLFGKSTYAVRGTSFSVKQGECFGLLGVNGAGKSTTFKMLTAEEAMTKGDVFAAESYLRRNRAKYLYGLGYCPQFGGLDQFLTGHENLRLLLTIRGLNQSQVQEEANAWINCVGLEKYAHRAASGYSGGCSRRLSAAAALSSGAPVSLLDEPTAGVDTAARRRVWAALRRGLAQNRSIIITSHSMDEMEALCSRIAIMSNGEICALGTPASLRAEHAAGYALRLKLKTHGDVVDAPNVDMPIDNLKRDIQQNFQSQLKDQHKTMLHYQINDKVPYSRLFRYLEGLKQTYGDLLEDYSITETTLEQVFLSFAKHDDISGPELV